MVGFHWRYVVRTVAFGQALMSQYTLCLRSWLLQRISAAYLGMFIIVAAIFLFFYPIDSYAQWRHLFTLPLAVTAIALFFVALSIHAWIGIKDIILDYVSAVWVRLLLFAAVVLLLAGCGFWVMRVIFVISLL